MVKLIYQFAFYSTDLQANKVKINKFRTTKNIKKILKTIRKRVFCGKLLLDKPLIIAYRWMVKYRAIKCANLPIDWQTEPSGSFMKETLFTFRKCVDAH